MAPSPFFHERMREFLERDADKATAFANSVLTELNWTFSEFISLIHEVRVHSYKLLVHCMRRYNYLYE